MVGVAGRRCAVDVSVVSIENCAAGSMAEISNASETGHRLVIT